VLLQHSGIELSTYYNTKIVSSKYSSIIDLKFIVV